MIEATVSSQRQAGLEPAPLSPTEPYAGLSPFQERDQDYFFGRDDEKAELSGLIGREVLTLLFGKSGLGKTSLLNAGVFPLLRAERFFPVSVRFSFKPDAPDFVAQTRVAIAAQIEAHGVDAEGPDATETLWAYFHNLSSG